MNNNSVPRGYQHTHTLVACDGSQDQLTDGNSLAIVSIALVTFREQGWKLEDRGRGDGV